MREEFEAWCEEELNLRTIRLSTGDYQSFGADMAWRAWQASRAAIEVKLPDDGIEDCEVQWGERCRDTFDCGYNFASVQHEKAMVAAGIKVEV